MFSKLPEILNLQEYILKKFFFNSAASGWFYTGN